MGNIGPIDRFGEHKARAQATHFRLARSVARTQSSKDHAMTMYAHATDIARSPIAPPVPDERLAILDRIVLVLLVVMSLGPLSPSTAIFGS